MSDISALMDVFNMTEVQAKTRASVLIKLGDAINYSFAANVTEPLVYELVKLLDPENAILTQARYLEAA